MFLNMMNLFDYYKLSKLAKIYSKTKLESDYIIFRKTLIELQKKYPTLKAVKTNKEIKIIHGDNNE